MIVINKHTNNAIIVYSRVKLQKILSNVLVMEPTE